MSAAISTDVLERLDGIREMQRRLGVSGRDDAIAAARDALDRAQGPDDDDRRRWLTFAAAWALYALELHDAAARPSGAKAVAWTEQLHGTWVGRVGDLQVGIVYPGETGGWDWIAYAGPHGGEQARGVCEFRLDAFAAAEEAHRSTGGRT